MCHSDESRPPQPPVRGEVADRGEIRLTAGDGARVLAYTATPEQPTSLGMVILPDVRGLHTFYKDLAVGFAEAGFHAVAFDYFARTAETDERDAASFDYRTHVEKTQPETIAMDVRAAVDYLSTAAGGNAETIFTVGFCFGGAASWRQSAEQPGLAGCIGFYGGKPMSRVGPWIASMQAPLLMLLAGVDSTPPEEFAQFAAAVRARGIEVEAHTYEGAPHSFFDRSFADHVDACADCWRRILDFTGRLAPQPA